MEQSKVRWGVLSTSNIGRRAVLPAIHVRALLLHRPESPDPPTEVGAYVAAQISGATVVALPGRDHAPYVGDVDAIIDEVAPGSARSHAPGRFS